MFRIAVALVCLRVAPVYAVNPSGDLRVEVLAAYNLVVDSNVESPSTYAPRAAYIGAKIWNDGTNELTDVVAYIGNYTNSGVSTPGIYPSRAHMALNGPLPGDEFALTHEGGSAGTGDATRNLGTIAPGEYVAVYWLISYPNVDENGDAVWGPSVKPDDDLYLFYDVWAEARDAGVPLLAEDTRKVTMRNEISSAANKILPNGANKVPQAYLDLLETYQPVWTNVFSDGTPGSRVWTEGYWYDLGNVGAGFDNDGDFVPDRNAWMQPVGDATIFDSSAFRLIRTYALVIVKLNDGTELVYDVQDQLYFQNLPENNRGAVGLVIYEFLPLKSGISSTLSPYQEVASGFDNEKFSGDYGATLGSPLVSGVSKVEMQKTGSPSAVQDGEVISYRIAFTNSGTIAVGDPSTRMPLVLADSVPSGTVYVAGSATLSNALPVDVSSYTVYYSTNHGTTWAASEPAAADVTDLQWWLSDEFPAGAAGSVFFRVTVDNPYLLSSPVIENNAEASFGGVTPFIESQVQTMILGTNQVGNTVFVDDGAGGGTLGNGTQDGSESGIASAEVRLYYDSNTNGYIDSADMLVASTNTSGSGTYLFSHLPDGNYLAAVNTLDTDIPYGYTISTPSLYAAALDPDRTNSATVAFLAADFGFTPVLGLDKRVVSATPLREGGTVTYTLTVTNRVANNSIIENYMIWATNKNATLCSGTAWTSESSAYNPAYPDGTYATIAPAGNLDRLAVNGYLQTGIAGTITNVQAIIRLQVNPPWNDDTLTIAVYTNNTAAAPIFTTQNVCSAFVTGDFVRNLTSLITWTPARFGTGNLLSIAVTGAKSGAQDGGTIGFDQAGFKVMTDRVLGTNNPAFTLNPVPLNDVYDADIFAFLSANPTPNSTNVTGSAPNRIGSLFWNNVGPLVQGGFKDVSVTYRVLEPPSNTAMTTTNTAFITNATYSGGSPANSVTDYVATVVQPAGTIGDRVWRDLDMDGIQDGGAESGIEGVSVRLTPPAGVDLGNGAGNPVTNVTDRNGLYLFTGLPADGNYTVTILTTTLPGGTGTPTYDEDNGTVSPNNATVVTLDYDATDGSDTHLTADFGYIVSSVIVGTIWHDYNRNGATLPDSGENWLTNITVRLYAGTAPTGSVLSTTTTDRNGFFRFTGAYSGAYVVQVVTNTGVMASGSWVRTYDTDGLVTPNYVATTVVSGGLARGDFSYYLNGVWAIGDTIFCDWDGDGVKDAVDEGIPGITVRLYQDEDGDGVVDAGVDALIASTVTGSSGTYVFNNRPNGTYLLIVDTTDTDLPARYNITADPYTSKDGKSLFTVSGANRLDQDFGFQPLGNGSIGDTVWVDANGDGVQSGPLETGIASITVALLADLNEDSTYVTIATQVTDSAGAYLFENLPEGNYRVIVDAADPDIPTDRFGVDYVPTTATQKDVSLVLDENYILGDFGFAALGAIGDTIFWDANRNGTQDYNEDGIVGVTVKLYRDVNTNGYYTAGIDTLYTSAVTVADGLYLFTALPANRYVVVVDETSAPIASADLSADPSSDGLPSSDPEAVDCDGEYGVRILLGTAFMGADFGYAPAGTMGDTVWLDANGDGLRSFDESGIAYVSVNLYTNGILASTSETDADGYYLFFGLPNGTYTIAVNTGDPDFPGDLVATFDPDGITNNAATNIVMSGGAVTTLNGTSFTNSFGFDFGYKFGGTNVLSGTVGLDGLPYDGLLGTGASGVSSNESPYAGVTLFLTFWDDDGDGVMESGETRQLSSALTDADGDYTFTGLPQGDGNDRYIISLSAPETRLNMTTTNGCTPAILVVENLDGQGYTLSAYQVVTAASVTTNIDFAFKTVIRYDYGDLPVSYSTRLENSPPGARHIIPDTPLLFLGASVDYEPNGQPSADATGDGGDEDGVLPTGAWFDDGTGGGRFEVTVNGAGYLVAFMDFNRDGDVADGGEYIGTWLVSAGTYTNTFTIPAGTIVATNVTVLNARFRLFPTAPRFPEFAYSGTATAGEVEDYQWRLGALGNFIWRDLDGDGLFDAGESPIGGVTVFADLNENGAQDAYEPSGVTGTNGYYSIGGFFAGTYTVRVDTNTLPDYVTPSYDLNGTGTPHTASVTMTNGQVRTDVDFGYQPQAVGGLVWQDTNTNGVRDAGENTRVAGVIVRLYNSTSNLLTETMTDSSGRYFFEVAAPGNYFVESFPIEYLISPINQGGDDTLDSDVSLTAPYRTGFISISAGEREIKWDLGVYRPPQNNSIGDFVWFDTNQDGVQDAGAAGVPGVSVELQDAVSNMVQTTVTDADGYYYFAGINPGSYRLHFAKPYGYFISDPHMAAETSDSDPDPATGFTEFFAVTTNVADHKWDAGMYAIVDLSVTKTVSDPGPDEGATIWFEISVSNSGPSVATGVEFTDTWPPSGLTLTGTAVSQGTFTPSNGVWSIGALNAGDTVSMTVTGVVAAGTTGQAMTNRITLTALNEPDLIATNNEASAFLVVAGADLGVYKSADPAEIFEGSNTTFTITITNFGPKVATSSSITDVLPAGLTYVSHVAGQGTYNSTSGVWSVGSLAVSNSASLTLTAMAAVGTGGTYLTNSASLTATTPGDGYPFNNTASAVVYVKGTDLAITKTVDNAGPNAGDSITYTMVVTNLGPNDTTGVVVNEPLMPGVIYVTNTTSQGSYNPVSGNWTVGALAAGSGAVMTVSCTVEVGTQFTFLTNTSTITASDLPDPNPGNDSDNQVIGISNIGIRKSSSGGSFVRPGEIITYTIAVTNDGVPPHSGVIVSDPLPGGVTYVGGSAQITLPYSTNRYVRDNFNSISYAGSDGTTNWAGDWVDIGETPSSPSAGYMTVAADGARQYVASITRAPYGLRRTADLSKFKFAYLSYEYRRQGLDNTNDYVTVDISANGGASWTPIALIAGSDNDSVYQSSGSLDISDYISTNTTIRFLSAGMGNADYVYIDNVQIDAVHRLYRTVATNGPSTLASGVLLYEDEHLEVTYQAQVKNPPTHLSITNTASVRSDLQPFWKYATVVDVVEHVDLGVIKDVNELNPGMDEAIWYTITLTNYGPHVASNVVIHESWPAYQAFYSNCWVSQGSYDTTVSNAHVWNVGHLLPKAGATLIVTGVLDTADTRIDVTNSVVIASLDQFDSNPNNNTDRVVVASLVVVTAFGAGWDDGGRYVEWETSSEANTAGFRVYFENEAQSWVLPAGGGWFPVLPGSRQGAVYRLYDARLPAGQPVQCRLQEAEFSGKRHMYGPFDVVVPAAAGGASASEATWDITLDCGYAVRKRVSDLSLARAAQTDLQESPVVLAQALVETMDGGGGGGMDGSGGGGGTLSPLKIRTVNEGVVRVELAAMASAMGVPLATVQDEVQAGRISIRSRGIDIPVLAGSGTEAIAFYSRDLDSPFAGRNNYGLNWAPGLALAATNGGAPSLGGQATVYRDTVTGEVDQYPVFSLLTPADSDFWYWGYALSGWAPWDVLALPVTVPDPDTTAGSANVTVTMEGIGDYGPDNRHHALVSVNGTNVGEVAWAGSGKQAFSFSCNQNLLSNGVNSVTIQGLLDTDVPYSYLYVDSISFTYDRHAVCQGQLKMQGLAGPSVTVDVIGATNAGVWNVTAEGMETVLTNITWLVTDSNSCRIGFVPASTQHVYVVLAEGGETTPGELRVEVPSSWASATNEARHLIIAGNGLESAAHVLADHRTARGLLSRVVRLEDVFDEFSAGIETPYAVRDFVACALGTWSVPPEYIVLCGAGSYDYLDVQGDGENIVPVKMVNTPHGIFASDGWFADGDSNGVPDVPIGRLPVVSAAECSRLIDKIVQYEGAGSSEWHRRIMLSADGFDPTAGNFKNSAEISRRHMPGDTSVVTGYLDDETSGVVRGRMLSQINAGLQMFSYHGHAGTDGLADENLLTVSDMGSLTNHGRPTVLVVMGCNVGQFDTPANLCLAEAMLLHTNGGAVAAWVPSGWAANNLSEILSDKFYAGLYSESTRVLGDAVHAATTAYRAQRQTRYILDIYNILGDPALILKGVDDAQYPYRAQDLTFVQWQSALLSAVEQTNLVVSAWDADPDDDGFINLAEFVLALNPRTMDRPATLGISEIRAETNLTYDAVFGYSRRKGITGASCVLDVSADLSAWQTGSEYLVDTDVVDDGNGQTETVYVYIKSPATDRKHCFIRLKVKTE